MVVIQAVALSLALGTGIWCTILRQPPVCARLHAEHEAVTRAIGQETLAVAMHDPRLRPLDMPAVAARRADLERHRAELAALIRERCPQ